MLALSSNSVVLNCLEIHSHAQLQDISRIHSLKIEDFSLLDDSLHASTHKPLRT